MKRYSLILFIFTCCGKLLAMDPAPSARCCLGDIRNKHDNISFGTDGEEKHIVKSEIQNIGLPKEKKFTVAMFGPSEAGKTTILKRLLLNKFVENLGKTSVANFAEVNIDGIICNFSDIPKVTSKSYPEYMEEADLLIYVFDGAKTGDFYYYINNLLLFLQLDKFKEKSFLLVANKCDYDTLQNFKLFFDIIDGERKKNNRICDFVSMSTKDNINFGFFKDKISSLLINNKNIIQK